MHKQSFVFIIFFFFFFNVYAQSERTIYKGILKFQTGLNGDFSDKEKTPLTETDLKVFIKEKKGLDFYPIDLKYRVMATFERNQYPIPFEMQTTTDRKPRYQKYGVLHFEMDGVKCQLTVYQNLDLMKKPEYKNYLFIPFTDKTNGVESYGGGRYLDLEGPLTSRVVLDFNKAYNPSCAYNAKYSCPIPPKENTLKVEIKAGVKKFH